MDKELIALYVDEYRGEIAQVIPDLCGTMEPNEDDADAIEDFAADYIHTCEKPAHHIPEIRAAAKSIARLYC